MNILKGNRTRLWNLLNAVFLTFDSVVAVMDQVNALYTIPEGWYPIWMAVYIVVNLILREVTTTPAGSKL